MKFLPVKCSVAWGYTATIEDRTVEVLRSYPGDWFVYAHCNGKLCKARSDEKRPMSYAAAMRDARAFLDRRIDF